MSYAWKNHLCGSTATESARSRPGDAPGITGRQPCGAAIGRVDVQPQALARRQLGELGTRSTEPVFVEPATAAIANGVRPGRAVGGDRLGDRRAAEPESLVGRHDDQRLGREPELVERPADREVRLVRGVHADAFEGAAARRAGRARGTRGRCTSRASAIAMKLAITPPDVRSPKLTRRRTRRGRTASARPPPRRTRRPARRARRRRPGWCTWASTSPAIDATSGGGVKYASERGFHAFSWCGATRSRNSRSTSPDDDGCVGAGAGRSESPKNVRRSGS